MVYLVRTLGTGEQAARHVLVDADEDIEKLALPTGKRLDGLPIHENAEAQNVGLERRRQLVAFLDQSRLDDRPQPLVELECRFVVVGLIRVLLGLFKHALRLDKSHRLGCPLGETQILGPPIGFDIFLEHWQRLLKKFIEFLVARSGRLVRVFCAL